MAKKKAGKKRRVGQPRGPVYDWQSTKLIGLAATMLARGFHKSQIKDAIAIAGAADGQRRPASKTFELILNAARELLRERVSVDIEKTAGDALEVYFSIVRDTDTRAVDRIRAQERIDHILGHEFKNLGGVDKPPEPLRVEISGPDGKPVDVSWDPKEELRRLAQRHRDAAEESEKGE